MLKIILLVLIMSYSHCAISQEVNNYNLPVEKCITDSLDQHFGYYLQVLPKSKRIKYVLVLLPGFTQLSESVFEDSDLPGITYENDILTVAFSAKNRRSADDVITPKLNLIFEDLKTKYGLTENQFILGGFSAGGAVALRYVELCHEYPEKFPILPRGIFTIDSPIDLYYSWKLSKSILENKSSEIAFKEAEFAKRAYEFYYEGTPFSHPENYTNLSPFSMDTIYGQHEKNLINVAVRTYHDVDIAWRIINRNQTPRYDNYIASAEMINRLLLMGNDEAEFIQSFKTGYRKNGKRHPHSWSIVDTQKCIEWMNSLYEN